MLANGLSLARSMLSSEPSYLVLFVTAVCNARCPMCFYWEEIESASAKLELSTDELKKVAMSLRSLYYLSIGGGEPFIRKDLADVVRGFYEHAGTRTASVATHGGFSEQVGSYIDHLTARCPGLQLRIQVSLDNLFEKHDENRRVKGLFAKAIQTAQQIAGRRDAGAPVMLSIGTVLTPRNRDDLGALRRYLDEHVAYDDLTLIYPRGNAKEAAYKDVTLDEYHAARGVYDAQRRNVSPFARVYRSVDRAAKEGIEGFLREGEAGYPWTCVAGRKMITLTERGVLLPCEMLNQIQHDRDFSLGNVRDFNYDVLRMLKASAAREAREHIVKTHCSCSYECAALCNTVFTKSEWLGVARSALLGPR